MKLFRVTLKHFNDQGAIKSGALMVATDCLPKKLVYKVLPYTRNLDLDRYGTFPDK